MGLHRFVLDLPQISNWLNQNKLDSEKVTPEELKTWADAGCFPFEKKGEVYRVSEGNLTLVEETKHLIKTEEYTLEEAKNMLQKAFHEKNRLFEQMERQELPSPDVLHLFETFHEETSQTLQQTGNGMILSLIDTETALKEHQTETLRQAEEKIKGAVLHAESRMKTVVEQVEKRVIQRMEHLLMQTPEDAIDQIIQQHQKELLGLTQEHERVMNELKETVDRQHEAYEELLCAGFFKRIRLKKEWKQNK